MSWQNEAMQVQLSEEAARLVIAGAEALREQGRREAVDAEAVRKQREDRLAAMIEAGLSLRERDLQGVSAHWCLMAALRLAINGMPTHGWLFDPHTNSLALVVTRLTPAQVKQITDIVQHVSGGDTAHDGGNHQGHAEEHPA